MKIPTRLAPLFSAKNFRIYTLLYALLILAVSSIPAKKLPSKPIFNDKVIHFSEYFIFGVLVFSGFLGQNGQAPAPTEPPSGKVFGLRARYRFWLALLFAVCFSLLDETVQSFAPGRNPDLFDALADVTGFSSAILVGWVLRKRR